MLLPEEIDAEGPGRKFRLPLPANSVKESVHQGRKREKTARTMPTTARVIAAMALGLPLMAACPCQSGGPVSRA